MYYHHTIKGVDGKAVTPELFRDKLYMIGLVSAQQNRTNTFVNLNDDDVLTLVKQANKYDMSEIEIVDMILDLNYA